MHASQAERKYSVGKLEVISFLFTVGALIASGMIVDPIYDGGGERHQQRYVRNITARYQVSVRTAAVLFTYRERFWSTLGALGRFLILVIAKIVEWSSKVFQKKRAKEDQKKSLECILDQFDVNVFTGSKIFYRLVLQSVRVDTVMIFF